MKLAAPTQSAAYPFCPLPTMPLFDVKNSFRVATEYQPLLRRVGLDADRVFSDPRIVCWRKLDDRENCTLDVDAGDGRTVRLHVKRYQPARGFSTPADDEVKGHRALAVEKIPTAPLVGWGKLIDQRSFTIWADLTGYTPADKLVDAGTPFDVMLGPTADLAARLHKAGLHHRDLYLCHFMAKLGGGGPDAPAVDLKLIDVARVRRLGGVLTRRRWIVKDLAQFWYSTTKQPVTDAQRAAWLDRYAAGRGDGTTAGSLRPAIERKVRWIGRHDAKLTQAQPGRNISIPTAPPAAVAAPAAEPTATAFRVRPAVPDDAAALIAHVNRICAEPSVFIPMAPGEFNHTVEEEAKLLADVAASANSVFLVAEAGGEVVGLLNCFGGKRRATRHAATLGISVRRDWRGRGVGTALLRRAVDWARATGVVTRLELEVYAANGGAVRLYERLGFVREGVRRRAVLHDGRFEDELVMALLL